MASEACFVKAVTFHVEFIGINLMHVKLVYNHILVFNYKIKRTPFNYKNLPINGMIKKIIDLDEVNERYI